MNVEDICAKTLITIDKKTSAFVAVKLMLKHGIGSLVVVSENEPVGVITRGDLIKRAVFSKGLNLSKLEVGEIMSKQLLIVEEKNDVSKAISLMARYRVKHVLVVKSGLPQRISKIASLDLLDDSSKKKIENSIQITPPMVGIVSSSDILKRLDVLISHRENNLVN